MSATWADQLAARLDGQEADRKTRDALKLRRDEVLQSQSGRLWRAFVDEGRRGVETLAKKCKDRIDIDCHELNVSTFKVEKVSYPAVSVLAKRFVDGIELSYYRCKDAHSESTQEQKFVAFDLDDSDRLVLSCNGHRLLGRDELLDFAIGPVFQL